MGNDGGSIPKRRELVKEAAKDPSTTQAKETQNEQQEYRWSNCALSNQPLRPPVVSDWAGNLYNKDAVLESLIANSSSGGGDLMKSDNEATRRPIGSLRDVVEVKFQVEDEEGENEQQQRTSPVPKWVCPITNKTLGPGVKAVYIVPCGHAFAESAVKEIAAETCLQCNEPYTAANIIPILPTSTTEKTRTKSRISQLHEQGLTHSLKKPPNNTSNKKRKKNPIANNPEPVPSPNNNNKPPNPAANGVIHNPSTASLTARVLSEEQDRAKKRKQAANENVKSLFSSGNAPSSAMQKHADFMTRGFSIPAAGAKR
ncbi:MAG: hypothetical protein Q9191_007258 [Dirinaria sp. TL-2023a]